MLPIHLLAAATEHTERDLASGGITSIGWVILSLAAAAVALERIQAFIRRSSRGDEAEAHTIRPSPLTIQEAPHFVPESDFLRERNAIEGRFRQMENQISEMRHEFTVLRKDIHTMQLEITHSGEERAVKIHERINLLLSAISEIKGRLEE